MSEENLCGNCVEREKSIACVKEFLEGNPDGDGMVCDPAPKAECKWHTGYGRSLNYQKTRCRDFTAK